MHISDSQRQLWNKIDQYSLDDISASFSFTKRLARENGWRLAYADRVVSEYKRFMFLATVADHCVSPSDQVDQAWHLHMIYTHSYWDEFCGQVLKRPIHHGPTRGGDLERLKFEDLYEQTKQTYRAMFGEEPPTDIWPDAKTRFQEDIHFQRINRHHFWVIRKPRLETLWNWRRLMWAPAAAVPLGLIAWSPFDLAGKPFLVFYGLLTVLAIIIALTIRFVLRGDGSEQWSRFKGKGQLPAAHKAYLAGGEKRLLQTAVCELLVGGYAQALRQQLNLHPQAPAIGTDKKAQRLSETAQQIFEKLQFDKSIRYKGIKNVARLSVARVSGNLVSAGLIQSHVQWLTMVWMSALLMSGVLGIGVMRIVQAVGRDRPFGFLVLEMIGVIIAGIVLAATTPYRTSMGNQVLQEETEKSRAAKSKILGADAQAWEVAPIVGLLGISALAGTAWGHFEKDTKHILMSDIQTGGSGGDGGSFGDGGCGGGGCGGGGCGGGGCGGCGG